jgi:radical SAM protein with 4Fe4S-binding SPASM domain
VRGIERLLERRLNVRLKTVLMRDNRQEFEAIRAMALRYGVKFRMDAEIFPRFNGDRSPLEQRVPPEEAVDLEFSDQTRFLQWVELFERAQGLPRTGTLYTCGAGMTHFHVDPCGYLRPCLMVQDLHYDLGQGGFLEGWKKAMPRIRKRKIPASSRCEGCSVKVACGFCPAFFRLENNNETMYSEYLCSIGQIRYQRILNAAHE